MSLKFKMAVLAALIGVSGAFATVKPQRLADHKWSRDNDSGLYTDITGQQEGTDYLCSSGEDVCTATYPAGQNPNEDPSNPTGVEQGIFN